MKNEESVGKLLYEFFMFFGDELTIQSGIKLNLKDGSHSQTGRAADGMAAVCPTTGRELQIHVDAATLAEVSAEFIRARKVLQQVRFVNSKLLYFCKTNIASITTKCLFLFFVDKIVSCTL